MLAKAITASCSVSGTLVKRWKNGRPWMQDWVCSPSCSRIRFSVFSTSSRDWFSGNCLTIRTASPFDKQDKVVRWWFGRKKALFWPVWGDDWFERQHHITLLSFELLKQWMAGNGYGSVQTTTFVSIGQSQAVHKHLMFLAHTEHKRIFGEECGKEIMLKWTVLGSDHALHFH